MFKKDEPREKVNYRPTSVLPLLSKVFKWLIYEQSSREYLEKNSELSHVQPQIILDSDYLLDYISASYDYDIKNVLNYLRLHREDFELSQ